MLLPHRVELHHHMIRGWLSTISSLSLGMMPDPCHFYYAQTLLSAHSLLGSLEMELSQNLFLYSDSGSGWPEWNWHVSFLSVPTGCCVEVLCPKHCGTVVAIGRGQTHWSFTSGCCLWARRHLLIHSEHSQGWGRQLSYAYFSQGLPMTFYSDLQRMTWCQCVCLCNLHIYEGMLAYYASFCCLSIILLINSFYHHFLPILWPKGLEENKLDPFEVLYPHLLFLLNVMFTDLDKTL